MKSFLKIVTIISIGFSLALAECSVNPITGKKNCECSVNPITGKEICIDKKNNEKPKKETNRKEKQNK